MQRCMRISLACQLWTRHSTQKWINTRLRIKALATSYRNRTVSIAFRSSSTYLRREAAVTSQKETGCSNCSISSQLTITATLRSTRRALATSRASKIESRSMTKRTSSSYESSVVSHPWRRKQRKRKLGLRYLSPLHRLNNNNQYIINSNSHIKALTVPSAVGHQNRFESTGWRFKQVAIASPPK